MKDETIFNQEGTLLLQQSVKAVTHDFGTAATKLENVIFCKSLMALLRDSHFLMIENSIRGPHLNQADKRDKHSRFWMRQILSDLPKGARGVTLCITGTFIKSENPDEILIMQHFIRAYTVC